MAELDAVLKEEHKLIRKRRKRISDSYPNEFESSSDAQEGEGGAVPRCENLIGLALSGGGIRSATTNIGVLQGLAERGVLRLVDYLSTVSGGGYIGACLLSLLSNVRKGCKNVFTTEWEHFPFREDGIAGKKEDDYKYGKEQMRHIRTGASYLVPRARHFSPDVMQAAGSVFISTFMTLLWFALLIVLITSMYMSVVSWVAPGLKIESNGEVVATLSSQLKSDGAFSFSVEAEVLEKKVDISSVDSRKGDYASLKADMKNILEYAKVPFEKFKGIKWSKDFFLCFVIPLLIGVFFIILVFKKFICPVDEEGRRNFYCFALVFSTVFIVLCGEALLFVADLKIGTWVFPKYQIVQFAEGAILIVPALFILLALFGVWFCYLIAARRDKAWTLNMRAQYHQLTGVLVVVLVFTLIWAMLPGFMGIGTKNYIALLMIGVGVALRYAMASKNSVSAKKAKGLSLPAKYKDWLLGIGVFVFLFLIVVYAGNVLSGRLFDGNWPSELEGQDLPLSAWFSDLLLYDRWPEQLQNKVIAISLELASFAVLIALAVFHLFVDVNKISPHYFYRDRLAEAFLQTDFSSPLFTHENTELKLEKLHGKDNDGICDARGPYLLLNATLNLTAAEDLKAFNRKSDIFTFSRLYVGSEETGYCPTCDYEVDGGTLKLARAMAISGAAVTSIMGMNTSLAKSFACTIFGVRLGYWLPSLRGFCRQDSLTQEKVTKEGKTRGRAPGGAIKKYVTRSLRLYYELFGHATADGQEIYLSDGGHSGDNLGIIPLLRRRVKVLIVSDSECDPEHAFDSFNSSVRNAYVDERIKIKICLDGLRKDEKGLTKDKFAVGRIVYPDQDKDQENWLILFKNTLDGKEISPITNYKGKSGDFPHESTADQFFTEEQFESYRALGRYGVKEAFGSKYQWLKSCSASDRKSSREAYGFLRKLMAL